MSTHRSLGSASLAGPALACLLLANATPPASAQPAPQKQVAPAASSSATPGTPTCRIPTWRSGYA